MLVRRFLHATLLVSMMVTSATADDGCCEAAVEPGCEAQPVMVEKVVCVPEWVTEKRMVTTTEYTQEQRTRTVTCYKRVAATREVPYQVTVMVPEARTRTVNYTVCKPVYETKTAEYQVRVPMYKDVEQTYTCRVPVYKLVDRTYTVMVPSVERRTGTRQVCKVVQTTENRTVTVDEGHYETQMIEVPCSTDTRRGGFLARCRLRRGCGGCDGCGTCADNGCDGCTNDCGTDCGGCGDTACGECAPKTTTVCKKVWVSNVVTKEVPVTVCKQVVEEQPYEYNVTVCRPETRTCQVRVCDYETQTRTRTVRVCEYQTETRTRTYQTCRMVAEQMSKDVQYTVCVPRTEDRTRTVTECNMVPYEQEVAYTVCVPHQVQKEVDVRVCRMVQKTISVPSCNECSADQSCGRVRRACCLGKRRAGLRNCSSNCVEMASADCCN
ncbi:MAG: hypothetical protein ACYC0X_02930 [Pirellulaceae bacterium]